MKQRRPIRRAQDDGGISWWLVDGPFTVNYAGD